MKLAEALSLRADLQKRIAQLGVRLNNNAKVQEGDRPAEDPTLLLRELEQDIAELESLIGRINHTNSQTLHEGSSLTQLIAKRDALSLHSSILRSFLNSASERVDRYSSKEIRIMSTVDVAQLQKQVDSLSRELRELDVKIQSINWTVDLI